MSISMVEKDAAIAYARAWNTLDATVILELLDEDARYASQWVLEELEGKDAISEYLIQKMKSVKDAGTKVYAELGITRSESSGRDCVLMSQGENDEVQAVVLFEINNNNIQRYDICMPELLNAERTGVYPS
jgi:hypothetical protein